MNDISFKNSSYIDPLTFLVADQTFFFPKQVYIINKNKKATKQGSKKQPKLKDRKIANNKDSIY